MRTIQHLWQASAAVLLLSGNLPLAAQPTFRILVEEAEKGSFEAEKGGG
jgi:hypothetical protein